MTKTNHKKLKVLYRLPLFVFVIGFIISLFPIFQTFATGNIFKVANAEIISISDEATADISSFDESTIYSKVVFHHISDEVTYKIRILNSSSEDYTISSITDDNASPYISYIYDAHDNYLVSAGEAFDFEVTAKYTTGVTDMNERVSTSTVKFFINFAGEEETIDVLPIVPNTGKNMLSVDDGSLSTSLVFLSVFSVGLIGYAVYAVLKHKKSSKIVIAIAIAASVIAIPTIVNATTTEINVFTITTEYHLMDKLIIHNGDEDTIINYGTPLKDAEIDDPEVPGQEFVGWEDEEGNLIDPEEPIKEDTTIIPRFISNQYTITFDTAGGSEVAPITQDFGTNVTAPADPTKTGYTFAGWSPEVPTTMPAENITVVAQWTVNQYTITFDTVGGSEILPITQDYNTEVTAPTNPTKSGYTFAGWTPEIPETMPAENITVVAQWTVNQYTITFDTDGGSEIAPITQDYNTEVTAPAGPTKAGYTFAGWNPEIPEKMPAENITVTAQWTVNQYTITFDTAGGSSIDSITQDFGTNVTAPANPTRAGYTFAGWTPEVPETMPAENITVTAQWTVNQYTITFDTAGGSEVAPITQDYGTNVTAPADPSRAGYTFAGWTPEIPTTMPAENMTVVAQWNINQYTITFDTAGGSEVAPITQNYNTEVTVPANPTRTGYTFVGWNPEIPETMPAEDITVTAQWTVNQYTITFDTDGGSTIAPITQDYNTEITAPANPTKAGYTFAGWNPEVPETMPAENITVTAQWTVNQYTITFDTAGGSTIAPITQDYNTEVTAPADPTKTGYIFAGWTPEIPETMPAENITITAQWTVNQYTITFDTDGGSEVAPITQDYNTEVTAPADPTKAGYTFAGWNPEIPSTMPAENITVVAQWTVNQYTITFDTDGGSSIDPITQDYGTNVTAPTDPTKAGYTFAGWSPEIPSTMPAENITVTAQWTVNQYTITFDTAGGSEISPITQDYNTGVTAPADPTRAGYTFAGWTPEIPTTMPAENMTVVAQWNINQYTITFDTAGGSEVAPITQNYNTEVTVPANPTRTGYTFVGWSPEIPETMPAENITVTAQWTVNQYTITFDTVGGSNINPITQDFDTSVTAPANPTKSGYTFAGWSPEIPSTMPAENITVTAQWTVNQYTITFDTDGGSSIDPVTQDFGTNVTAPADPTKAGYTFAGWNPEIPETMPAENITVTAQWNANQITIHFDKNNDDATGAMEDLVFNYDAEQALPNNGFSREHYHFASWNTEADGSGTTYANEASAKNINTGGATTLYAQWEADSFTITFNKNANDATGNMSNQTVTYDTPTTLNANAFTREHYAFNGWNTAPDGSGTSYEDAQDVTNIITENVTLYAQWAVTPYTIIFDKNAEDTTGEMANQSVPYGQTVNLTTNAYSRESADFVSWNTKADGTGTNYANEAAVKNLATSGEITLYAQWKGFINYQPNASGVDGTMGHQPVSDNANVTLLASNFSRTGYGFAGWNTEPDYSGTFYGPQETITAPAGASKNGITLYAVWVASAGSLQDAATVGSICNSLTAAPTDGTANLSSVSALTDSRDNNTYAIAKLADGKCWMIENLRLEAENTRTPEKQALAQGYGGQFIGLADTEPAWANNTTAANSLYYSGTQEGTASVDIGPTDAGYRFPRYNHDNTNSRASNPTTNNAAMYSYGNYYTWAAMIADTDAHTVDNQIIANTSICPSGWHLPTGGGAYASDSITGVNVTGNPSTYREFYNLGYKIMDEVRTAYEDTPNTYQSYYSSATTNTAGDTATQAFRKYPNNFIYSGAIFNSLVNDRGNSGSYWSSATYDRRYVYIMNFNAARVIPGTVNSNKFGGMPARCVASSALVSFNKNATDATGEMATQELLPGVATNLTANTFTREHYAFSGWNTAPDGSGTAYDDEASITVDSASPITLYAQWAVTPYTIVFDKNSEEATGEMASLSVPYGETISLTANAFTRESYYFGGWNTAADGSGTTYADKASVKNLAVDGEVTLYAHWMECPGGYVCYKPNGATADGTTENPSMGNQAVNNAATSIKLLASNFKNPIKGANSKKAGFAGWNTKANGSGTSYGPNETISITAGQYAQEGLALYAMWVESAGDLQSWTGCSALGDGAVTALTDNRDNNTYAVAKLADGNCWMIENLRLADKDDSDNAVILSAANTNAPALPLINVGGTTSNSLSPSQDISVDPWCTNRATDCTNVAMVYTVNTETPTVNANSANHNIYSYGNYYNWYSATAGNNSSAGDICPAGWHLPYGGSGTGEKGGNTSGGFYYLGAQLGVIGSSAASNTLHRYPNNFVLPGALWGSAVSNKGVYGFYSTNTSGGALMHSLRDTGNSVDFAGINERPAGLTVRCVTHP